MSAERLIPVFMPTLVSTLLRHERAKGSALTEAEAIAIRDGAMAVMVPESQAIEIAHNRGYDDIDPERCWAEWRRVRTELS